MIQGGEDQLFWDIRGDREQGETWAGVSKRTRCVCLVNGCALVPEADTSQVVHVGRREAMQRWEKRDVSRWACWKASARSQGRTEDCVCGLWLFSVGVTMRRLTSDP